MLDGSLTQVAKDLRSEDEAWPPAGWPVTTAVTDNNLRIVTMSPVLARSLGLEEGISGGVDVTLGEVLTPASRALLRTVLEIQLWHDNGLTDVFLEFRAPDGRALPVIAAAAVHETRNGPRVRWVFIAAPRRAEFERRLVESRRDLQHLAEELRRANAELAASKAEVERQARELAERARQLELAASCDPLTGALNRRGLEARAALCKRLQGALILLDIDCFKRINDERGHAVGDRVLASVADVLRNHLRPSDAIARIGGEEFVVWAPTVSGADSIRLAERLRAAIAKEVSPRLGFLVTVSVGVGEMRDVTPARLWAEIARVDSALYEAKAAGRDRVACAIPQEPKPHGDAGNDPS